MSFQCDVVYLQLCCALYLETLVEFSYEKNTKRKGLTDKRFNMIRCKEILLETQGGYQKLQEIGMALIHIHTSSMSAMQLLNMECVCVCVCLMAPCLVNFIQFFEIN